VMGMPICYGADEVLDHIFWFRRGRKPVPPIHILRSAKPAELERGLQPGR
jgi:hypothetical protein